jgi:LmbE family N-acetylglucosaminyl deacetylase
LFEALGVIRTEELLAARRYDRALQFFTPNYEFGYSKTADETLEKWGRDALVGDFVRVIRQFRPEVVISRFSGTPSDGHGHHQAAGIATMEAFAAAADPDLYPEYGPPWQAKKLYQSGGGRGGTTGADVRVNVGEYGAALGRSYHEVAMEGRSLHRTQSMGAAQDSGPRFTNLTLVEKTVPGADDEPLFSRTTATLMDLAQLEPALRPSLEALQTGIDDVRENARR